MAQRKLKSCWYNPSLTIDCMLAQVSTELEADGCILESSDASCELRTPERLKPGEFVKVRLWLESEGTSIDIPLAEVRTIRNHWISVEVIHVSSHDRSRLKRLVDTRGMRQHERPPLINRLLIRA
ncbi:MAG TPA: hypothetical protein VH681_13780 [Nitrospiraceae bacterium]|jgi:hypothetical protein